jgi:septal ring factor EnvC (AmiA/AmiB activator)
MHTLNIVILSLSIICFLFTLKIHKMANQHDIQQHLDGCQTNLTEATAKVEALKAAKAQLEADNKALMEANATLQAQLDAIQPADPNAIPAAAAEVVNTNVAALEANLAAFNQAIGA